MIPVWPNQPVPTPRLPNMPSAAFAYALSLHHSIIAPFGSLASIDVGGNQENVLAQGINVRDDLLIFHLGAMVTCIYDRVAIRTCLQWAPIDRPKAQPGAPQPEVIAQDATAAGR